MRALHVLALLLWFIKHWLLFDHPDERYSSHAMVYCLICFFMEFGSPGWESGLIGWVRLLASTIWANISLAKDQESFKIRKRVNAETYYSWSNCRIPYNYTSEWWMIQIVNHLGPSWVEGMYSNIHWNGEIQCRVNIWRWIFVFKFLFKIFFFRYRWMQKFEGKREKVIVHRYKRYWNDKYSLFIIIETMNVHHWMDNNIDLSKYMLQNVPWDSLTTISLGDVPCDSVLWWFISFSRLFCLPVKTALHVSTLTLPSCGLNDQFFGLFIF